MIRREFLKIFGGFGGLFLINPLKIFHHKLKLSDVNYSTDPKDGLPVIEEYFNNGYHIEVATKLKELFYKAGGFDTACITNLDFARFASMRVPDKWITAYINHKPFCEKVSKVIWGLTYTDHRIDLLINKRIYNMAINRKS